MSFVAGEGVKCMPLTLFSDSLGSGVGSLYPQGSEVTNSKSRDVYKLPPPTAPGPPGDACRSRIPSPLQPETQGTPDDEVSMLGWLRAMGQVLWGVSVVTQPGFSVMQPSEPEPSPSTLIYRNMQRWKRIRQR